MTEPVFLLGLAIAGGTFVMITRTIAAAFTSRSAARGDLTHVRDRMDEHAAAIDDAQAALSQQAAQLAELQERLDFAERLLAKSRDRSALGPGEPRQ